MVSLGDVDNDGLIDFSEFVNYCTEHEEKLWAVFDYLDINKDGNKIVIWCCFRKSFVFTLSSEQCSLLLVWKDQQSFYLHHF